MKFVGRTIDEFKCHVEVEFFPGLGKKGLNQKIDISDALSETRIELVLYEKAVS